MVAWVKAMMLGTSMQAVLDCFRAFQETDFRADLPRIDVPTLIVHGDADRSRAAGADRPADRGLDPRRASLGLRGGAARPRRSPMSIA